jgi:hypothetical protein
MFGSPLLPEEREAIMPLIQGGPPEWIWERTPEALKWEIVTSARPDGQTAYELRVQCGLEIMRLQFFTAEEVRQLASLLAHRPTHGAGSPSRRATR